MSAPVDVKAVGDHLLPYLHMVCQGGPVTAERVGEAIEIARATEERWTLARIGDHPRWRDHIDRLAASTWTAHRVNAAAREVLA